MGKVIAGIFSTLVVAGIILFLLFHFGILNLGEGNGNVNTETVDNVSTVEEETEEITITIVVTQDEYYIDEQKVTMTQIKEKVMDKSATIKVILEDNYASAKAWDDIKTKLMEWEVIPIEQ